MVGAVGTGLDPIYYFIIRSKAERRLFPSFFVTLRSWGLGNLRLFFTDCISYVLHFSVFYNALTLLGLVETPLDKRRNKVN